MLGCGASGSGSSGRPRGGGSSLGAGSETRVHEGVEPCLTTLRELSQP